MPLPITRLYAALATLLLIGLAARIRATPWCHTSPTPRFG